MGTVTISLERYKELEKIEESAKTDKIMVVTRQLGSVMFTQEGRTREYYTDNEIIKDLVEEIGDLEAEKRKMEFEIFDLKNKVANLEQVKYMTIRQFMKWRK